MIWMNSTVWDAQQKLFDLLYSDPTLAAQKISVTLGTPTNVEREHVWVASEVDDWQQRYAVSGLAAKDEEFTLRVHVLVDMTTNIFADARDRVRVLGTRVEEVVKTHNTLDDIVMLATIERAVLEDAYNDMERRRGVILTMLVRCRAHWTA